MGATLPIGALRSPEVAAPGTEEIIASSKRSGVEVAQIRGCSGVPHVMTEAVIRISRQSSAGLWPLLLMDVRPKAVS